MPDTTLTQEELSDVQAHLPLRQDPIETHLLQQMLDTYRNKVKEQIKSL